jgi:hydroxymethylglutaryl-CoA lyase
MAEHVEIFEVGPRDGLQNETRPISTAEKIALIDLLSDVGFSRIEVASFVDPKRVPQMADGAEVLAGITRNPAISYAALTPNMRGLERAIAAGVDEIAVFGSASEGFSQANINCSISESMVRFQPVIRAAFVGKIRVRGYVSCITDCPYDGPTDPLQVARVASALLEMGCYEISLGDTIGKATPQTVQAMLAAVMQDIPAKYLAGHFHDTAGQALLNIEASLGQGLRVFDSAIGGLGGCPFAPGSPGNVATEAVHDHLATLGYDTGLTRQVLAKAATLARSITRQ